MKKLLLSVFLCFPFAAAISQAINVSTTTYTVPQLVTDVLFGSTASGGGGCAGAITNVTWSTGTNFGSTNGIGYFQNANPSFPMSAGVILTTGNALNAPGPNTGTLSDGSTAWPGDTQLFNYITALGIDAGLTDYNNATILEFDFTPLTNTMSFDFLFASDEYGTFQCSYSDAFAFFLTNVTAGTPPTNLALIPSTTTPVSVVTIRDDTYNNGCSSENETYFGNYNNPGGAGAATDFNGETVVMSASSLVVPNNVYHIKLVIADRNDQAYDSAVFLGAGSFNIGQPSIVGIGPEFGGITTDFLIADETALCPGATVTVQAGAAPIAGATYSWTVGGAPIPGANSFSYTITQTGTYAVTVTFGSGCSQTDDITVEYYPAPPLGTPLDLTAVNGFVDLTTNIPIILNGLSPADYNVTFHTSLSDAQLGLNPIANPDHYPALTDGQQIFVAVEGMNIGCIFAPNIFFYIYLQSQPIIATTPPDLQVCDDSSNDGQAIFDFTNPDQATVILGSYNPANYTVTYHLTAADATNGAGAISPINAVPGTNGQTIYVRLEDNADPTLFGTTDFQLIVNYLPSATISGSTTICPNATAVITFNGTPGATVTYTVDGGANQTILLNASGTNSVTTPALGVSSTYSLVSAANLTTTCSQAQAGSAVVTVSPLPTATISGTTALCQGAASPVVTFTGAGGIAPYTFTYTINGGASQTVVSVGNTATVSAPTTPAGVFTYALVSVQNAGASGCLQNQSGSAIITVNPLPTASVSGTVAVCQGDASPVVTFTGANGTAPYTFTYTIGAGPSQSVTTTSGNSVTVGVPTTAAGSFAYNLVSVQDNVSCSQAQAGSAVVTVSPLPTATISGTTALCQGAGSAVITFTGANGVAPYTFTYTINGGAQQAVVSVGNTATVNAPTTASGVFTYDLVSVKNAGAAGCLQNQSGSATITVNPLPTALVSGTVAVCRGDASPLVTFTAANGTGPYTFTYNINGGAAQSVTTTSGNSVTVGAPTTAGGSFVYNLVSVQDNLSCSQAQAGSATITVNELPTAAISGTATVCQDAVSPQITFTGSNGIAPYTFTYNINGGTAQTVTTASGNSVTVAAPATAPGSFAYNLLSVQDNVSCSQAQAGSATVTVKPLPAATVSGAATACQGSASPAVTFTGSNGTAPYTFSYNINGGSAQSVTTTSGNSVTVTAPTTASGNFAYNLLSVTDAAPDACSQAQPGSVTIVVDSLPTAAISGTVAVCQGAASPAITFTGSTGIAPYTFTYNIGGGANLTVTSVGNTATVAVPTAAPGIFDYNLVSVQDSSVNGCFQNQGGTATVTVNTAPSLTAPTPYDICDDNNDGFSCLFDLHTKDSSITGGAPGVTVTYHETLADAQNGVGAITAANYCNIVMGVQTLYIRVFNPASPACYSTTTLVLHVNPVPVANPNIPPYALCDVNSPGDGIEGFDLPTKDLQVLNGQTATVTYYTSLADAQGGTGAINTSTLYYNTTPGLQQIWVRLEYGATGCFGTGSFSLVVNPLPVVTAPAPMSQCSEGTPNTASFNLAGNDLTISGGVPGIVVSYHLSLADAQGGIGALASPYTNISNPQTIFVRVEKLATGCFDTTTLTLNVTQGPLAVTPTPLQVCDPNNDGFASFDLTSADNEIAGGSVPAGVSITYHETFTDAQTGSNPKSSPYINIVAYNQTMYVRVFYVATGCYNIVELQLHVNNTPQATQIDPLEVCDDNADGTALFDLTLATSQVLGSLDPALHTVTYYLDQPSAQAGTGSITSVLAYSSATGSVWVRVEDNATGCFDVIELGLQVNPLPLLPPLPGGAVAPYSLCDVNNPGDEKEQFDLTTKIPEILNGQTGVSVHFYLNLADAQAGTPALTDLYINASNAQTLYVTLRNDATGCFVLTTMDLRVEPLPSPIPPTGPVTECDPDRDGFAAFDLDALITDMLQGAPNITITFHETLPDAQSGANPLASPYTNIVPFTQFIYVRAEDNLTRCSSVMMIGLNVIPAPEAPQVDDIVLCDDDLNNQNGYRVFNLRSRDADILAAQSGPASNYVIGYYLSQADADLGTSPIGNAANYTNSVNPQQIWYRVGDANNECYATGSFYLRVDIPLALTTPTPLAICDDGPTTAVPQVVFDLTLKNNEITGGLAGDVAYYLTQADAQNGVNAIASPASYTNAVNPQTLWVAVTTAQTCRSFTTLTIRVLPLPSPRTPDLVEACDDDTDGSAIFDLTVNENYIRNNDPNMAFEYYPTQADAQAQTNQIVPATAYASASGEVWIRVVRNTEPNFDGDYCYVIIRQELQVNPLPSTQNIRDTYCDASASGSTTHQFNLGSNNADVIAVDPGQDVADYSFTYYVSLADAQSGTGPLANSYTNTSNPQDVYVVVENNTTHCSIIATVTLEVLAGAVANPVATSPLVHCDDDGTNDGIFNSFDLTQMDATILGSQPAAGYSVAYFTDAAATQPIADPAQYGGATGSIYAQVTNTLTGCPSQVVTIAVTVEKLPEPSITTDHGNTICVEFTSGNLVAGGSLTMDSNLANDGTYTFEWTHDGNIVGTGSTYTVTDPVTGPGLYTVTATSTSLGCVSVPSAAASFTVIKSGPAELVGAGYTVTNAFSDTQVITVDAAGFGQYEYSLDGGPWQSSNVFTNVGPGEHDVLIRDVSVVSCGDTPIDVINVIDYPHYFTPNGDGVHDTWNIIGMGNNTSAKIYIFDRYGKLLKQLSPVIGSNGWDGTFNGEVLPSTDYWFKVEYKEANTNKEFKAHFSLKR
jgi:gliding motility-associated-like protein